MYVFFYSRNTVFYLIVQTVCVKQTLYITEKNRSMKCIYYIHFFCIYYLCYTIYYILFMLTVFFMNKCINLH